MLTFLNTFVLSANFSTLLVILSSNDVYQCDHSLASMTESVVMINQNLNFFIAKFFISTKQLNLFSGFTEHNQVCFYGSPNMTEFRGMVN